MRLRRLGKAAILLGVVLALAASLTVTVTLVFRPVPPSVTEFWLTVTLSTSCRLSSLVMVIVTFDVAPFLPVAVSSIVSSASLRMSPLMVRV